MKRLVANPAAEAAQDKLLLLLRGARGVHHVEPEGEPRAHLVNVIDHLIGCGLGLSGAKRRRLPVIHPSPRS